MSVDTRISLSNMYDRMIPIMGLLTPFLLNVLSIAFHDAVLNAFFTSSVTMIDVFLFTILVFLASSAKSLTLRTASIVPVFLLNPYCLNNVSPFLFSPSFSLPKINLSNSLAVKSIRLIGLKLPGFVGISLPF